MVCGDVGTGKTMLITYLLSRLPDSVHPILIANPDIGYVEILRIVAGVLKTDVKGKRGHDLVEHVKAALVEAGRQGESFVLIIDEAQLLPDKSIEQIRLLSNIETPEQKLFQILLLGQYELSHKLSRPEMRQLRQRININRFLAPMDAAETIQYIDHRLKMAGSSFDACFEPHCRHLIFKMTNGVPRSINQLCDSALLVCMTEKMQKVNKKFLKMAGKDLRSDILFTPRPHADSTAPASKTIRLLAVFFASAVIWAMLGIYGYQGRLGEGTQNFLHRLSPSVLMPPPSNVPIKEEALPSPPKTGAEPEKDAIPPSADFVMPASGQQTAEKNDSESDSGAFLPEVKQSQPTETPVPPEKTVGNVNISNLLSVKDTQPKMQASVFHTPQTVVVKKGDTLIGIASFFFPTLKKNKDPLPSEDKTLPESVPETASSRPVVLTAAVLRSDPPRSLEIHFDDVPFVTISSGSFLMGSPEYEPGRGGDETCHEVTLTRGYAIQTTPVTQGQWQAVMGKNPSCFVQGGQDCPVEGVSWNECQQFIKRLNEKGDYVYRLPTDPPGAAFGPGRVVRGGSWFSISQNCRSAGRFYRAPNSRSDFVGFRLVRQQ